MNEVVGDKLTKGLVDFLNNCYATTNDNSKVEDYLYKQKMLEQKVPKVIEKYLNLVKPNLKEPKLEQYSHELQENIVEYIEDNKFYDEEIESIENIERIAFLRLAKTSKDYYTESVSNSDPARLIELRKKAKKLNDEYRLIARIN